MFSKTLQVSTRLLGSSNYSKVSRTLGEYSLNHCKLPQHYLIVMGMLWKQSVWTIMHNKTDKTTLKETIKKTFLKKVTVTKKICSQSVLGTKSKHSWNVLESNICYPQYHQPQILMYCWTNFSLAFFRNLVTFWESMQATFWFEQLHIVISQLKRFDSEENADRCDFSALTFSIPREGKAFSMVLYRYL